MKFFIFIIYISSLQDNLFYIIINTLFFFKCVEFCVVMPKGFLIKRHEEMSAVVETLYRPWSETPHQEEPVDFSLRTSARHDPSATILEDASENTFDSANTTRLRRNSEQGEGNRLYVRTPDSGFSSPSDNSDAYRRTVIFPSVRHYLSQITESLHVDTEQTVPLALIKKHEAENSLYPHSPEAISSQEIGHGFHVSTQKSEDSRYLLSPPIPGAFPLLSPSVYWPHGSSPLRSPIPFTSPLGRGYDVGFQTVPTSLTSPHHQEGINLTSPSSNNLSTPVKQSCKSPGGINNSITPSKRKSPNTSVTPEKKNKSHKKTKASRRLNFDDEKTSPVSGTIIRELVEGEEPLVVRKGDIDPAYNVVEITEEAKTELAKIDNKIGDYVCKLCKELYDDAFGLAQHRCSRIIHVEYRCPECDKVFNCPANLASHRRWHKPKGNNNNNGASTSGMSKNNNNNNNNSNNNSSNSGNKTDVDRHNTMDHHNDSNDNKNIIHDNIKKLSGGGPPPLMPLHSADKDDHGEEEQYECNICSKTFRRQAYLRKHLATHCDSILDPDQRLNQFQQTGLDHHHSSSSSSSLTTGLSHPHHHHLHHGITPHHSGGGSGVGGGPPPLTPILSPTYPGEMLGCRLCSAAFFTSAALQLHVTTAHHGSTLPDGGGTAVDGSSPSNPTSVGGIHVPRPQYSPRAPQHILNPPSAPPPHLLHHPSPLSAPS